MTKADGIRKRRMVVVFRLPNWITLLDAYPMLSQANIFAGCKRATKILTINCPAFFHQSRVKLGQKNILRTNKIPRTLVGGPRDVRGNACKKAMDKAYVTMLIDTKDPYWRPGIKLCHGLGFNIGLSEPPLHWEAKDNTIWQLSAQRPFDQNRLRSCSLDRSNCFNHPKRSLCKIALKLSNLVRPTRLVCALFTACQEKHCCHPAFKSLCPKLDWVCINCCWLCRHCMTFVWKAPCHYHSRFLNCQQCRWKV